MVHLPENTQIANLSRNFEAFKHWHTVNIHTSLGILREINFDEFGVSITDNTNNLTNDTIFHKNALCT